MKKLLIIALLFWGCEDKHAEIHYSCPIYGHEYAGQYDDIIITHYAEEMLIHTSDLNYADSLCLDYADNRQFSSEEWGSNLDSVWCECEAGVDFSNSMP